jgi:hypothetical protein
LQSFRQIYTKYAKDQLAAREEEEEKEYFVFMLMVEKAVS